MRINEVKPKEVNVTLNADELVLISNIMYFYEKHCAEVEGKDPKPLFHELNAEIDLAKDMCQYGGIDTFTLKNIVRHTVTAHPDSRWSIGIRELLKCDEDMDPGIVDPKKKQTIIEEGV